MTPSPARKTSTVETRAQDAVNVLTRRLAKIQAAKVAQTIGLEKLAHDETAVQKRLTYAQANPDLPEQRTP